MAVLEGSFCVKMSLLSFFWPILVQFGAVTGHIKFSLKFIKRYHLKVRIAFYFQKTGYDNIKNDVSLYIC